MTETRNVADTMLCLLRGEMAAYETYRLALAQQLDHLLDESLLRMCREHLTAIDHLRLHARRYGGSPEQEAHAWDGFAQAVEASGTRIDNVAALGALREGERDCLVTYLEVMNDTELPPECRNLVRLTLLPQTENHIAELDRLIEIVE